MEAVEFAKNITEMVPPLHPFYPLGSEIVGYLANDWNVPTMLAAFVGCMVVLMGSTYMAVERFLPNLTSGNKFALHWFVLSTSLLLKTSRGQHS